MIRLWGCTTGIRFPTGTEIFLIATASKLALDPTQPHIRSTLRALSLGLRRTGCAANPLLLSSAEGQGTLELYLDDADQNGRAA
jgi:hypothetical protein